MQRIIKDSFFIILVSLFFFSQKEQPENFLSFSLSGKIWAFISKLVVRKMTKSLEKYFYFSIYTNLFELPPTNWTGLYSFQLVRFFFNKTVNSFKRQFHCLFLNISVSLHIFTKIIVFDNLILKILLSKYWVFYELDKGPTDPYNLSSNRLYCN